MAGTWLRFEADYDLPREIVWDALVDSDLVSGWLAEADIEPRVDGRYDLRWLHLDLVNETTGQIVDLVEPELLIVDTDNFGTTTFELTSVPGGARGSSTRLVVSIAALADPPFTPMIAATWRVSLEQLDELLRGRPVDWGSWRSQRAARWHAWHEQAVNGR